MVPALTIILFVLGAVASVFLPISPLVSGVITFVVAFILIANLDGIFHAGPSVVLGLLLATTFLSGFFFNSVLPLIHR